MKKYFFNELKFFFKKKFINIEIDFKQDDFFIGLGSIQNCKSDYITFFDNLIYSKFLNKTTAKACLIKKEFAHLLPKTCNPIIVSDPYLAYAELSLFLSPDILSNGIKSNQTFISNKCVLGKNVQINEFVTINDNTKIDNNCIIFNNSIIGPNVEIGNNTKIRHNCVISDTKIGENCVIQSGTVIGEKGFGFINDSKIEIRHTGNVIIGNNVDIGSNCTIDKASLDSTIIEDNVRIDNLVQIAHNISIGKNTIIAAQCGIAGSASIGENCLMGGQVGIAGHITIGNNVTIAAKSGVTKNIDSDSTIAGFPAVNIKKWKKSIINQYKDLK